MPERIQFGNEPTAEKEQKAEITFLFFPHGSKEDARYLREAFEKTDAYAPEFPLSPDLEGRLNELSQGNITPQEFQKFLKSWSAFDHSGPFETEMFDIIYKSKKPILGIDIPKEFIWQKEWAELKIESKQAYSNIEKALDQGDLKTAINYFPTWANFYAEMVINKREEAVAQNLKEKVKNISEQFPELKNKNPLNVLVTFGSVHSSLPRKVKDKDIDVKSIFSKTPYIYSSTDEAFRRMQYGKNVDANLIAHGYLENLYNEKILDALLGESDLKWEAARKAVAHLSFENIENIYKKLSEGTGLKEILTEFKVPLPTSRVEVEKLIK